MDGRCAPSGLLYFRVCFIWFLIWCAIHLAFPCSEILDFTKKWCKGAIFTFGLSVPIGAAIGAGSGWLVGTAVGVGVGAVGGGTAASKIYQRRESSKRSEWWNTCKKNWELMKWCYNQFNLAVLWWSMLQNSFGIVLLLGPLQDAKMLADFRIPAMISEYLLRALAQKWLNSWSCRHHTLPVKCRKSAVGFDWWVYKSSFPTVPCLHLFWQRRRTWPSKTSMARRSLMLSSRPRFFPNFEMEIYGTPTAGSRNWFGAVDLHIMNFSDIWIRVMWSVSRSLWFRSGLVRYFELFFAYLIIQEFADLWQLRIYHPANEDFRNASLPDSTQLADSSLFRSSDDTIADQHPLSLIIFSILDYTWHSKIYLKSMIWYNTYFPNIILHINDHH